MARGKELRLPYYPRYVERWATSRTVRSLKTFADRGVYCELLDRQWQEGSLPADPRECFEDLAVGTWKEFERAWKRLEVAFPVGDDGRRRNEQLEEIRAAALNQVESGRAGGKASASARQSKYGTSRPVKNDPSKAQRRLSEGQDEGSVKAQRTILDLKGEEEGVESCLDIGLLGDLEPHPQARALPDLPSGLPPARRRRSPKAEPEGFAEFYTAFPLHVARVKAAEAYRQKQGEGKLPPLPALLLAVAAYRRSLQVPDPPSTCYPATWIRAERWDDDLSHAEKDQKVVDLRAAFLNHNGGGEE